MKVIVKVTTEEGKYLLREMKGLREGTILEGTRKGNAFEFKWNGCDAVLWFGDNCEEYKNRKKSNRMQKGWMMDITCRAITNVTDEILEVAGTKAEILEAMEARGWKRDEYSIGWAVIEYNVERDFHGTVDAIGETKAEAIKNFWQKYNEVYSK